MAQTPAAAVAAAAAAINAPVIESPIGEIHGIWKEIKSAVRGTWATWAELSPTSLNL